MPIRLHVGICAADLCAWMRLAYMFLFVFCTVYLPNLFSLRVQTWPPSPLHAYKKDARRYILRDPVQLPLSARDICIAARERIFRFVWRETRREADNPSLRADEMRARSTRRSAEI